MTHSFSASALSSPTGSATTEPVTDTTHPSGKGLARRTTPVGRTVRHPALSLAVLSKNAYADDVGAESGVRSPNTPSHTQRFGSILPVDVGLAPQELLIRWANGTVIMRERFVSEAIRPVVPTCDTSGMGVGEPGLPREFLWRGRTIEVVAILRTWRETGKCRHGSPEMYVRKHWIEVATIWVGTMKIYFDRQPRRGQKGARW